MNIIPVELFPTDLISKLSKQYAYDSARIGLAMDMIYGMNGNIIPTEKEIVKVIENAKYKGISLFQSIDEFYLKQYNETL